MRFKKKPKPLIKFRIDRKYWMIFLVVIILGSALLEGFMNNSRSTSAAKATLYIKFSDYEVYNNDISVFDNTTVIQAISQYYYVRLDNGSNIYCIASSCNNNRSTWLTFNKNGYWINATRYIINPGDTIYVIYNGTSSTIANDTAAIRNLLKL